MRAAVVDGLSRLAGMGSPRRARARPLAPGPPPRVTVVVTCFNYGRYLAASVGSALDQQGVVSDVVLVDDASPDGSGAVAEALFGADDRVQVVRRPANGGPVAAFNDGLALATGTYLVRLDADDLLTPGSLRRAVELLEACPEVGLSYGHPVHFVGEPPASHRDAVTGWTVWPGRDWLALRCRRGVNCITSAEVVVRTAVARQVGGMNPELPHTHDLEWWMRFAAVADVGRVGGADQAFHREHDSSRSATEFADVERDLRERVRAFASLFGGAARDLPDAAGLEAQARRTLAGEALDRACRAIERGEPDTTAQLFEALAREIDPACEALPQWRAYRRRRRARGSRLLLPFFVLRPAARRLRSNAAALRWRLAGV